MENENIFLLQPDQFVFDEVLCLVLRRVAVEKHEDGMLPAYYFHVFRLEDGADMGWLDLRVGDLAVTALYGHVSYCLSKPYRGHGYMTRAVSMLLPLAKAHGMSVLRIHCAADNLASQGVCRKLGARFESNVLQPDGTIRQRFCLEL